MVPHRIFFFSRLNFHQSYRKILQNKNKLEKKYEAIKVKIKPIVATSWNAVLPNDLHITCKHFIIIVRKMLQKHIAVN